MRRFRRAAVGFLCGLVLLGTGAMAAPSGSEMGGVKVNVNTASAAELASLPGIGPSKAQAIVEHRAKEPFTRAEDLRKVKGIGPKLYDAIREQITVGDAPAPSGRGG
jgi:competence protein ComEA